MVGSQRPRFGERQELVAGAPIGLEWKITSFKPDRIAISGIQWNHQNINRKIEYIPALWFWTCLNMHGLITWLRANFLWQQEVRQYKEFAESEKAYHVIMAGIFSWSFQSHSAYFSDIWQYS